MKTVIMLMGVMVIVFSGCSEKSVSIAPTAYKSELAEAPKWVLHAESNGSLCASASAPITDMGLQSAINEAENMARVSIAKQIEIKVSAMDETFKRITGEKSNRTSESVKSEVFRIITHQSLVGVQRNNLWISPSGEVWVLMNMQPQSVEGIKIALKSGYKNASAQYQQAQMKEALSAMDEQIEKIDKE